MTDLKNKKIAIVGFGVDTEDVLPFLLENDCEVTVIDRKAALETEWRSDSRIHWQLGKENFGDLTRYDLVIRNPAIYRYRAEIVEAEKKGVEISSKTKIFFDLCPAKIIGVTGTKGKGTTSMLIYEMLKVGGKDIYLGGNIGVGMFNFLPKLTPESWVVLELSSFQLIDLHKSPHIGVVLMTTVEHQDWHVSPEEYVNAKKSIVEFQTKDDFAVINDDYENSRLIGKEGQGRKFYFSRTHKIESGCYLNNAVVMYQYRDTRGGIVNKNEIKLRGEHNVENVMAAALAAHCAGGSLENIRKVVQTFKGLEHRLEEVATINGVTFYNDSFSTVPETTIAAIKSFTEPVILIVGGSDKGSNYDELGKTIVEMGNVKKVLAVGSMASRIQTAIKACARGPLAQGVNTPEIIVGLKNMEEIVLKAYTMATSGDVVLLSPACASFDMFKDYKDRGTQFKKAVLSLQGTK